VVARDAGGFGRLVVDRPRRRPPNGETPTDGFAHGPIETSDACVEGKSCDGAPLDACDGGGDDGGGCDGGGGE
jgi:hypothetical protein